MRHIAVLVRDHNTIETFTLNDENALDEWFKDYDYKFRIRFVGRIVVDDILVSIFGLGRWRV